MFIAHTLLVRVTMGQQVPELCSSLTPLQILAELSYSLHATPFWHEEVLPESFGEKRSLLRH
jgi:hypothetical protein